MKQISKSGITKSKGLLNALYALGYLSSSLLPVVRKFRDQWRLTDYDALIRCHIVTESELADVLAKALKVSRMESIPSTSVCRVSIAKLSRSDARNMVALPVVCVGDGVSWVVSDPTNEGTIDLLRLLSVGDFKLAVAERQLILAAVDQVFPLM